MDHAKTAPAFEAMGAVESGQGAQRHRRARGGVFDRPVEIDAAEGGAPIQGAGQFAARVEAERPDRFAKIPSDEAGAPRSDDLGQRRRDFRHDIGCVRPPQEAGRGQTWKALLQIGPGAIEAFRRRGRSRRHGGQARGGAIFGGRRRRRRVRRDGRRLGPRQAGAHAEPGQHEQRIGPWRAPAEDGHRFPHAIELQADPLQPRCGARQDILGEMERRRAAASSEANRRWVRPSQSETAKRSSAARFAWMTRAGSPSATTTGAPARASDAKAVSASAAVTSGRACLFAISSTMGPCALFRPETGSCLIKT